MKQIENWRDGKTTVIVYTNDGAQYEGKIIDYGAEGLVINTNDETIFFTFSFVTLIKCWNKRNETATPLRFGE